MSKDSAMDSLSTTSDHSVASSNDSVHNLRNHSPRHHNDSGHHGSSGSRHNSHDKTRTPTPCSPQPPTRDSRILRDTPHSPLALTSVGPQMLPMPHPLTPPQVSTPNSLIGMQTRMAQSFSHLPPHGLGLLNSFMHHASPLDLMAAAHHHVPPRSYNSPPPISSSDPTANECKLVDYRGQKVAAFMIQGETMLCLPQAFELFLKHLVGGLHTVYTKLKRLDIVPLVCNVEQVRILRGLGAIQPGVNRCKLLACKDFDVLYRDCTTARCLSIKPPESSRPGRPPKRGPVGLSLPASHIANHHPHIKKHRLDNDYPYENGHITDISRLDKSPLLANGYNAPPTHLNHIPFMQMGHHSASMMNPGIPPHIRPENAIMKSHQNLSGMEAITRSGIWENCRAAYEDIVKHLERLRDERGDEERNSDVDGKVRSQSPRASSNGHSPVLNLSKSGNGRNSTGASSDRSDLNSPNISIREEEDNISEGNVSEVDETNDKEDDDLSDTEHPNTTPPPVTNSELDSRQQALNYSTLTAATAANVPNGEPDSSLSSTETLLRNIQGLLKVAADNARQQERQINFEKAELKMDVLREREVKDSLERQFTEEQKLRILYQKRYKRERRLRTKLQQQMENEFKKRTQIEEILKASGAPAEALRILTENNNTTTSNNNHSSSNEHESAHKGRDNERDIEKDCSRVNKEREKIVSSDRKANSTSPKRPTSREFPAELEKNWNYPPGLDNIMATGAFWQNYSESIAKEMELERKNRQTTENDVKGPLQERPNYYKNSMLYTSAT